MKVYIISLMDYSGWDDIYEVHLNKEKAEETLNKIRNGEIEVEYMKSSLIEREVVE